MKSVYREERWAEANKEKEGGVLESFSFQDSLGDVSYRFIKKTAGCMDGMTFYDISSYRGAAGPYINRCLEEEKEVLFQKFIIEFDKYCKDNHIVAEFSKLDPWNEDAQLIAKCYGAEYYGNFYCTDLRDEFFTTQYNRRAKRSIKKALDAGITVEFDHYGKTIPEFVELYHNTEIKHQASDYYRMSENDIKYYFENFGEDVFFSNAFLDNRIITSVLVIMGEDIAHYFLLGADSVFSGLQANSLLTYKTALYCKEKGKKLLDMGGGKPGGGTEQFKRNFISDKGVWEYYAVKKIRNQMVYDRLVAEKNEIVHTGFFPLYRG